MRRAEVWCPICGASEEVVPGHDSRFTTMIRSDLSEARSRDLHWTMHLWGTEVDGEGKLDTADICTECWALIERMVGGAIRAAVLSRKGEQ